MKIKMLKRMISIVFAVAMATSCVAMSVGAAPEPAIIAQIDWAQGYDRAVELNDLAHDIDDNGTDFDACSALADELEEFFNEVVCAVAVYDSQSAYKNTFAGNVNYVLNHLRSVDVEQRSLGVGAAIDNLYDIADCIQAKMH